MEDSWINNFGRGFKKGLSDVMQGAMHPIKTWQAFAKDVSGDYAPTMNTNAQKETVAINSQPDPLAYDTYEKYAEAARKVNHGYAMPKNVWDGMKAGSITMPDTQTENSTKNTDTKKQATSTTAQNTDNSKQVASVEKHKAPAISPQKIYTSATVFPQAKEQVPETWQDRIRNAKATDDDIVTAFKEWNAGNYTPGPKTIEAFKAAGLMPTNTLNTTVQSITEQSPAVNTQTATQPSKKETAPANKVVNQQIPQPVVTAATPVKQSNAEVFDIDSARALKKRYYDAYNAYDEAYRKQSETRGNAYTEKQLNELYNNYMQTLKEYRDMKKSAAYKQYRDMQKAELKRAKQKYASGRL